MSRVRNKGPADKGVRSEAEETKDRTRLLGGRVKRWMYEIFLLLSIGYACLNKHLETLDLGGLARGRIIDIWY